MSPLPPTAAAPRVALVTGDLTGLVPDRDSAELWAYLREHGIDATTPRWDAPDVAWADLDLILLRSPWDYPRRTAEFLTWMRSLPESRVLNPPRLVEWNLDKRYLLELAAAGAPVIPSVVATSADEVVAAARATGAPRVVIKPTVSVGSQGAHLLEAQDPQLGELAGRLIATGKDVLVQPAIEELSRNGEHDLVFLDGEFSHAVRKGPILELGGGLRGGSYTEELSPVDATPAEVAAGARVLDAVVEAAAQHGLAGGNVPLWARFDLVTTAAGPLVIEAELFEPQLFLRFAPGSAARLGEAVLRRLRRSGPA